LFWGIVGRSPQTALPGDEGAGLLLRPFRACPLRGFTQGCASLHPRLRSCAASRLDGSGYADSGRERAKSTVSGLKNWSPGAKSPERGCCANSGLDSRNRWGGSATIDSFRMSVDLTDIEARVLGALIEKEITTPDYYPLSLNALVNACNQKSNRDPVVAYDEHVVRKAIGELQAQKLAAVLTGRDHRVPKYRHWAWETLGLGNREMALLCVMLLRGPQTPGELKGRTERMHPFDDLESVESCLQRLVDREAGALAAKLPRQPGSRESRYLHLLSGDAPPAAAASANAAAPAAIPADPSRQVAIGSSRDERIASLESKVISMEGKIDDLVAMFDDFRKQFE